MPGTAHLVRNDVSAVRLGEIGRQQAALQDWRSLGLLKLQTLALGRVDPQGEGALPQRLDWGEAHFRGTGSRSAGALLAK